MKKILWLTSWYPSKISPTNGDFIQRHAEAVSLFEPVHVIHVIKDEEGIVTLNKTVQNLTRGQLSESIGYYKPFKCGIRLIDRGISLFTYLSVLKQLINEFIKDNGMPRLVHLHIAMWAGLLATWLKKKKQVAYLLTEHWTGYDSNALQNVYNKGWLFKTLSTYIIRNADLVLPVSEHLGKSINKNISPIKFTQVSNVVNTRYFHLPDLPVKQFTFIHVSSMNYQKNIEGLLRSFSKLLLSHKNWKVIMAGRASQALINTASQLGLDNYIEWTGGISYERVAEKMQESSALILFSRYENQPCVILEALCTGLPVIATNVGGIPEVITQNNGLLVKTDDEEELLQAMIRMIENYNSYDNVEINMSASQKYDYRTIGKIMSKLYEPYLVG